MSFRKNVITKKIVRYYNNSLRPFRVKKFLQEDWNDNPPVLVNSFPKSGTHLLHQILSSISELIDYGNFIASMPSFTFREVSSENIKKRINYLLPGELVASHIHYDQRLSESIESRNIFKLFIYRDLRDVTISEAHYLRTMNKWHKLAPYFRECSSIEETIGLSLNGLNQSDKIDYPNVVERFKKYSGWLTDENTMVIKFEDLVSQKNHTILESIADNYIQHKTDHNKFEKSELTGIFSKAIKPDKSHTFRSGKVNQWKDVYSEKMNDQFLEYLNTHFTEEEIKQFKLDS